MDPQTIQAISKVTGDVKDLLDALKAAGITNPELEAADAVAGGIQAALASGTFDPKALVPLEVAELNALKARLTNPVAQYVVGLLANALGKLLPPAGGGQ